MPNLPITLELVQVALKNFEGRPITEELIQEVTVEVDRLRTREDHAPDAPAGPLSAQAVGAEAEAEAAAGDGPADEPLAGDDAPAAPDAAEPAEADVPVRVPKPREKMQKLVVVYDPESKIPRGTEVLSYIVEIPADEPPDGRTFDRRLSDAVTAHNDSKRGSKHPVETMRDALQNLPYDWLRYYKVRMLTETPVYTLLRGADLPAAAPVVPPPPAAEAQ